MGILSLGTSVSGHLGDDSLSCCLRSYFATTKLVALQMQCTAGILEPLFTILSS